MLLTFQEAIEDSAAITKRHLLLGNGFSIACKPDIFRYGKLYEQANFDAHSRTARVGFNALETQDFERVIRTLRDSAKIAAGYGVDAATCETLRADAEALKNLLVDTISASHPAWPGELSEDQYASCRQFLSHFSCTYTFNYDLLLYWVVMHTEEGRDPTSDDGFRSEEDNYGGQYVVWDSTSAHTQNLFYLHGALHLFDTGMQLRKYTWCNTGVRLVEQIRAALEEDHFPLFVSEGESAEKFEKIRHNDYLTRCYKSFSAIGGALFVFGHSFADNDDHYISRIGKGRTSHLYVGLHGDENSPENTEIKRRANALALSRSPRKPLTIKFYDTETAKVWG